ncbi:MAG: exo-alpha-sialidase [candidate division KSB1 bacterium]|nr:exo-alpha-sialidase [candidate division KSB1 bacterium]
MAEDLPRWTFRSLLTILVVMGVAEVGGPQVCLEDPVVYVGSRQPKPEVYDGGLPHAVGVHSVQVWRANRAHPLPGDSIGWTYNHAPMLAHWQGRFWIQFISNPKQEHDPPGRTLLVSSRDGVHWSEPQILFPEIVLSRIEWQGYRIPEGFPAVMHQRCGWYVAPNGRLLAIGCYSFCPNPRVGPNRGQAFGHVVREVFPNGSLGPIYFVRYNRQAGWGEHNAPWFPFYRESSDTGFVHACDSLLANRLITLQWWEMEQTYDDPFYCLLPPRGLVPKALCFFHRADGAVVAIWKQQLSALSFDEGRTWTPITRSRTLWDCSAKVWGQRTDDGRYALVYNHSATRRNRFPLVVLTSDDGHLFDRMLCAVGEVPPMRYQGLNKNLGPQYVRGIVEGNGNPPGDHLWVAYSMNKEDIWVSRLHVPITDQAPHVQESFDGIDDISDLELWSLYLPLWAPVKVVRDRALGNGSYLALCDEDPYDYALAERSFPSCDKVRVDFRVYLERAGHACLEVEVQGSSGARPLALRFDKSTLSFDLGKVESEPIPISTGVWYWVQLEIDCQAGMYQVTLEPGEHRRRVPFAQATPEVSRLVFRTGPWRGLVPAEIVSGEPGTPGLHDEDRPGAETKAPASVFFLDDVRTHPLP